MINRSDSSFYEEDEKGRDQEITASLPSTSKKNSKVSVTKI